MAFHLHRLNLTGEPLRNALSGKAYLATALSQARMPIQAGFIAELATQLNIAADELTRALIEDEAREWSFYRSSANNRAEVWSNVARFAADNNLSLRTVAEVVGMKVQNLSRAISGTRPDVLTLHQAQKLADTRSPPLDPAVFIGASNERDA